MEQNSSLFRMFIVILIIEFVITFLVYSQLFIPFAVDNIQDLQIYSYIISLITFIINPFFVLIGFYYLGKKLDLKSKLKSVIIRLLIGAYLGQFFSITILNLVEIYFIEGFNFHWLSYLGSILSVSFLGVFFATFTALAIAYMKQTD
jgi:hypothetical protein